MADKISVNDALDRIESHVAPSSPQTIALDAIAHGAVLTRDVMAAADAPRFDCSAMDGFAVRSSETFGATEDAPARFELAADIRASSAPGTLLTGIAAPISTGAPVPVGADAVIAKERCHFADGRLYLCEPVFPGRNVRRQGEDMCAGAKVASAGTALSPVLIGALLAYGVTRVATRPLPRVKILSTGSEFTAGDHAGLLRRFDSNGPMIGAMCRSLGLEVKVSAPLPDALDRLDDALNACRTSADLILSTGGVSAGTHDLVREALENIGARIVFHGVAMRPGKPMLFAVMPDGTPFFGLPGNPVAALVGFRFFALAAIRRQLGLGREPGLRVSCAAPGRRGITQYLRAGISDEGDIVLAEDQRSHVMRSLIDCDHWVRIDGAAPVPIATIFPQLPSLAR